ncbi:hypothetical protein [Streptomyces sp. NPDC004726]
MARISVTPLEGEYIRDRPLEGHESARKRGKTIGGAGVTDDHMLSMALHLREQEMSLRDIAARLVITTGKKKGQHLSAATVTRMLREHDEQTTAPMRPSRRAGPEPLGVVLSARTTGTPLWPVQSLPHSPRVVLSPPGEQKTVQSVLYEG